MKKIISTLFFVAGLMTFGFAQEANEIAVSQGATELAASKISGEYEFTLPSNLKKDEVDKYASYYTNTFTVDFDEASHTAKIKMIKNGLKDRYVMARLLTACKVKFVKVDDDSLQLYDFIDAHLK